MRSRNSFSMCLSLAVRLRARVAMTAGESSRVRLLPRSGYRPLDIISSKRLIGVGRSVQSDCSMGSHVSRFDCYGVRQRTDTARRSGVFAGPVGWRKPFACLASSTCSGFAWPTYPNVISLIEAVRSSMHLIIMKTVHCCFMFMPQTSIPPQEVMKNLWYEQDVHALVA
jgi:hypothetical protein